MAGGISPDNQVGYVDPASDTTKVLLLPTGIGETKTVAAPNFRYRSADWASDGHTLVMRASESGKPLRFWVQNIDGGAPRAVTPEGTDDGLFLTIRHTDYVCARDTVGIVRLYPIDGGEPKTVAGVNKAERVVGASPDSDIIYVSTDSSAVARKVVRVMLQPDSDNRLSLVEPNDPAGVLGMFQPIFTSDQKRVR